MASRWQYRGVDEDTERRIGDAFRAYAEDGALTRHGLKCAVTCLTGMPPSRLELDAILPKHAPADGEPAPTLGAEAFSSAMRELLCAVDEADVIRQTFRAFDTAYKGYITFDDFAKAFALTAPHIHADTLRLVFDEVDTDRNGKVSWGEFERMMRSRAHRLDMPTRSGAVAQHVPAEAQGAWLGPSLGVGRPLGGIRPWHAGF